MIIRIEYLNFHGFECFGMKQKLPLPRTDEFSVKGRVEFLQALPLGIGPITCPLSNILELGWEGLSWNITPCAAPSMLRSLTPALRVETMGGGVNREFPLNVRLRDKAPVVLVWSELQSHTYVVPKPSYLLYDLGLLNQHQKTLQIYSKNLNGARNVNLVLTLGLTRKNNCCRSIAAMDKILICNDLNISGLSIFAILFVVLNVAGSSPTGHPTNKPADYQIISRLFCVLKLGRPP